MSIGATILIVAISFTLFNCNSPKSSKMPITTSSEKALEYFNEGIALAQKLRVQEADKGEQLFGFPCLLPWSTV